MNPITAEEQAAFDHFGLRQYQINAVMRVREAYRNGARNVLLCAPTAAGKTRISACVVHLSSNRGKQAHFVVDRENLIDQTSRTFDQFKIAHGVVQQKHWRYRPYERAQVLSVQTVMRRGCALPSPTALQPVATTQPELPPPPAWAMVPPPTQTSTERLRSAFSGSPETTTTKSAK